MNLSNIHTDSYNLLLHVILYAKNLLGLLGVSWKNEYLPIYIPDDIVVVADT